MLFRVPGLSLHHRTVLTGTEKPEACQLLVGAPDIPVDKGQSGVQASRCRTGLVDIVGSKSFIEEVYVPEPECIAFPKEIGPVVFAVVPYGLFPGVFIVGQCTDCRGCSGRIVVFVPSSCLGEGLDAYRIIVPKACEEGYLYLQAFFHGSQVKEFSCPAWTYDNPIPGSLNMESKNHFTQVSDPPALPYTGSKVTTP